MSCCGARNHFTEGDEAEFRVRALTHHCDDEQDPFEAGDTLTLFMRKPSEVVLAVPMTRVNSRVASYTFEAADLDEVGLYDLQLERDRGGDVERVRINPMKMYVGEAI